jgi:hypothetical protein
MGSSKGVRRILVRLTVSSILAAVVGISPVQAKTDRLDARINTDTGTANQYEPAIAMNRYGSSVIVWESQDGASITRVYGQILNEKGIAVLGNFAVDTFEGIGAQVEADVAMNDRGHFTAVWSDSRDGLDIMARMFYANGAPKGPSFRVNDVTDNNQLSPSVTMDTTGNFAVTWTDFRSSHADIYLQRYGADGTPVGGNVRVSTAEPYSRGSSEVFLFNDGRAVVAWQDAWNLGVNDVYLQRFDAAGNPSGGNVEVSTHAGQETDAKYPAVAGRENGDFLVCWQFIHAPGINDVYGRLYDASGGTLKDVFVVNETDGGYNHVRPDAAANPKGGWGVAWDTNREGTRDIRARSLAANGDVSGASARVSDTAGEQKDARVAIDGRGIALFVWGDDRNGNSDIYGTWSGSLNAGQWKPLNPYAASGFDGMVPITWDPVYGQTGITRYHISRSSTPTGPFSLLTTVNLTDRGAFGGLFRDWLDTSLENGRDYYYTVTAEASGVLGPPSDVVHAVPAAGSHALFSAWAVQPVTIDGLGEPGWAESVLLNGGSGSGTAVFYVKNNADSLFIGIWNGRDNRIDALNAVYLLFDSNNDNAWDVASPSGEGLIIVAPTTSGFNGLWGTYPDGLGTDPSIIAPAGVETAMAAGGSGFVAEIALDLHASPLKAVPGQTIGFGIWLDDPGTFYPTQYGYAGEWPQGLLRENAATLGDLTLASAPDAVERPVASGGPASFGLGSNFPNPFNPETVIPYDVAERSRVRLDIFDLTGSRVKTLTDAVCEPGRHTASWDGRTSQGAPAPSGVYVVRLRAGDRIIQSKITLIR